MKRKIVFLNVILMIYILSVSIGYAFFNESLDISGVASTVEYYDGEKLPTMPIKLDTTNNKYHTSSSVPNSVRFDTESWIDDTYTLIYSKNKGIPIGDTITTEFTISFINPTVLQYTDGQVTSEIKTDTENQIVSTNASISKTSVNPGESVDITFTLVSRFSSTDGNETVTATISYMLQGKRRYFYFVISYIDNIYNDYTFTINPTPSDASVTINGQNTKTITVTEGTKVTWSVSKNNYETKTGEETINRDMSIDVNLAELVHDFGEWTLEKPATCTENGIESRYCSQCGLKETREIAALGHNYTKQTIAPSFAGRGYNLYTCSRCGHQYTENISDSLYIVKDGTSVLGSWSNIITKGTFSSSNSSGRLNIGVGYFGYGENLSYSTASYIGTYGVFYIGPINLTGAKQIYFKFKLWDDLYHTYKCGFLNLQTCYEKGRASTTVGLANSSNYTTNSSTAFVSGKYTTKSFTRSASSESAPSYEYTLSTSGLTGNYYIKVYVKHDKVDDEGEGTQTAYTGGPGFSQIRIDYN